MADRRRERRGGGGARPFSADPRLAFVRASTVEVYGASDAPPADAIVYFRDVDEHVGAITKYAKVEAHAHAR